MNGHEASQEPPEWHGPDLRTFLDSRAAWQRDQHLLLARSPGGGRTHLPDCTYIRSTIEGAEACIAWLSEESAPMPHPNVPYPKRAGGTVPTCRVCAPLPLLPAGTTAVLDRVHPDDQCGRCGARPATGFASINNRRYCHDGGSPTCYEDAQRNVASGKAEWA